MREQKGKRVLAFLLSVVVLLGTLFSDAATAKAFAASNATAGGTTFITAEDRTYEYDGEVHHPSFDMASYSGSLIRWEVYDRASYASWGDWATPLDLGYLNDDYGLAGIAGRTEVGEYTYVVYVSYPSGFFGRKTATATADLIITEPEDPNATYPVAVYATAGYVGKDNNNDTAVAAWNENIKTLTGVNFVQYDGYAPLGVIYVPKSLIKSIGDSSQMLTNENIDTVLSYLSTLDTSVLTGDGANNANNIVKTDANYLDYIERDVSNAASSHKTAMFTWNRAEVGYIAGSSYYPYHLDIRFSTENVSYIGVIDGKTKDNELKKLGDYTHLKGAAIDAPSYNTGANCTIDNKEYYVEGYFTDKKCTNPWTAGSKDYKTIYVKLLSTHKVTIDPNGGNYSGTTPVTGVHAGQVIDIATPTRDGYTFTGWTGGKVTNGAYTVENKDVTLKAEWSANDYTLTVDPNGGTYNKQTSYDKLHINDTKDLGATSKTGYTFTGWTVNDGNHGAKVNGNKVTMGAADAVVTANFAAKTDTKYTVVYKYEGLEDSSETKYGTTDSTIDIDALIAAGAKVGYTVDSANTTQSATIAPDGSTIVTVAYEKIVYTLNVVAGNGIATASADKATYKFGETATLTATADTGYNFANWSGVTTATAATTTITFDETFATANAGTEFTATANANIQNHTITVEYYDEDGVTAGTESKSNDYGVTVEFTPNPGEGHTAYEGTKDPVTGKIIPDMDKPVTKIEKTVGTEDETIIIVYVTDKHTVTVNYVDANGGTVSDSVSITIKYGTGYGFTSPVKTGYTPYVAELVNGKYVAKEVNGEKVSGSSVSGTMGTSDITVDVVYVVNEYDLIIHYLYSNDTLAKDDYRATVAFGDKYEVESPEIENYTADKSVVTGTMPAERVEITVKYSRNTYDITVQYYVEGSERPFDSETITKWPTGKVFHFNVDSMTGHTPYIGDEKIETGDHQYTVGTEDATIIVLYKVNVYNVSLVDGVTQVGTNLGTVKYDSVFVRDDFTKDFVPAEHEGYDFSSLTVNSGVGADNKVVGDVVIVANYEKQKFTYSFVDYDGSEISNGVAEYGELAEQPESPTRTNWKFAGWTCPGIDDEDEDIIVTNFVIKEPTVFKASYTQTGSNLKVNYVYASDKSSVYDSIDQAYDLGTDVYYLKDKEKLGYSTYIYNENEKVPVTVDSVYKVTEEDKEITVYYEPTEYLLTVKYVSKDDSGKPFYEGTEPIVEKVNVPYGAKLSDYYSIKEFDHFTYAGTTGLTEDGLMGAADLTITVEYSKIMHSVIIKYLFPNDEEIKPFTRDTGELVPEVAQYEYSLTDADRKVIPEYYTPDRTTFSFDSTGTEDLIITVNCYKPLRIIYLKEDGKTYMTSQYVYPTFDENYKPSYSGEIALHDENIAKDPVVGVGTYDFKFAGWKRGLSRLFYGDTVYLETGSDVELVATFADIPVNFYLLLPGIEKPTDEFKDQGTDKYTNAASISGNDFFRMDNWNGAKEKQIKDDAVTNSNFFYYRDSEHKIGNITTDCFTYEVDGEQKTYDYQLPSGQKADIEWYVVKVMSDGIHVDGFVKNQVNKVTVLYVDNANRTKELAQSEEIEVNFDATTAEVEVKDVEGYSVDRSFNAAAAKIEIVDGKKVIYVPYGINTYTLTIHFFTDDDTYVAMPADEKYPVKFNAGYEYDINDRIPEGFHVVEPENGIVKGGMPARDKVRNVELAKNEYTATVTYEIVGGKTEAPDKQSCTAKYEEYYSVSSPDVPGYTPEKEVVTGTFGTSDVNETVKYYANTYDLVIEFYNDDEQDPYDKDVISVSFNEDYEVEVPAKEGYTPDVEVVKGTMDEVDGKTVKVTYNRNTYNLTITIEGLEDITLLAWEKVVPESKTTSVSFNDSIKDFVIDIFEEFYFDGYKEDCEMPEDCENGLMPAHDVEIKIIYTKNEYKVTYLYEDMNIENPYAVDTFKARECFKLRTDAPEKAMDDEYYYTFRGWLPIMDRIPSDYDDIDLPVRDIVTPILRVSVLLNEEPEGPKPGLEWTEEKFVTGINYILQNYMFFPIYQANTRVFTVTFVNYDGTVIGTPQKVMYDGAATAPAENPTRISIYHEDNTVTHFQFAGWDKAFDRVTSDLIVTATYTDYTGDMFVPDDNPPTENPPAENPPAQNPPAQNPPAENPPAENPPAENPPAQVVEIEEEKVPEQAKPEIIPEPVPEPVVVEIPEDKTPLAASSHCIIHWIILMITLLDAVYAVLRAMANAKKIREEEKEVSNN